MINIYFFGTNSHYLRDVCLGIVTRIKNAVSRYVIDKYDELRTWEGRSSTRYRTSFSRMTIVVALLQGIDNKLILY